jgi:predicted TIM-barrel fold metal-dependent hydrolase
VAQQAQLEYTGPDRNPRPAHFKPPKNSCDVHAHLYGPKAQFPYPKPLPRDEPPDAGYDEYMKMHEVLGIDRGVLTQSSRYGTDNSALLDALKRAKGALRGIVAAHVEDITDKFIAEHEPLGVRGIRIHKDEYRDIEEVSRRIAGAQWRVELVPTSIEEMVALRPVFERMKCGILIDQMGLPDASKGVEHPAFQGILSLVRDGLIWIKLSHPYHVTRQGPPYADVLPFAQALVDANKDRCLWGTDWPHPQRKWPTPNDGMLLDLLADWVPDEKIRNQILVDNPAKLNRF